MIPGPHPSMVALYGAYVTAQRGAKVLSTQINIVDGALEINGNDGIPEALSFTVAPDNLPKHSGDALAPYGQTVTPIWVMETHDGRRVSIRRAPMLLTGWDDTGRIHATGLLERVAESPWALPSSPRRGAALREEVQRLVGDKLPVIVEAGNPVLPFPLAWGGDRVKSLNDLCASYRVQPVVKADGYLHLVDATRGGKDIVARYSTDTDVEKVSGGENRDRRNLFKVWAKDTTEVREGESDIAELDTEIQAAEVLLNGAHETLKNITDLLKTKRTQKAPKPEIDQLVVQQKTARADAEQKRKIVSDLKAERKGERSELTEARRAVRKGRSGTVMAVERITTGPLAISTYGERSICKELEAGTSYEQCRREALRLKQNEISALSTVRVQILTDPRLEIGDVISVTTPSRTIVGRITKLSLPMKCGETMRIDLQEVAF